jgi:predicted tellurium resistance membrane protein TerC
MFNQVFEIQDIWVVGVLIILEGVLSIDNALVLGLLAKRVRPDQQARVLTYGLVGAFVIRLIAIGFAQYLMGWRIVKLIGGGYLVYVAVSYFYGQFFGKSGEKIVADDQGQPNLVEAESGKSLSDQRLEEELEERSIIPPPEREFTNDEGAASDESNTSSVEANSKNLNRSTSPNAVAETLYAGFWKTILVVELTDLAFAVDSILAGIALVGAPPEGHVGVHPKLWVVVLGGMLGVMLMRVAAMIFIKMLERFPRFELSAYLLVLIIGTKLCLEWIFNTKGHEHRLDFHDYQHPAFIAFWTVMTIAFLIGFIKPSKAK